MGRDSAGWGKAFHTWCLQTEASTRLELFPSGTAAVADRKEVVAAGGRCQLQWGHERASGLTCFRGTGLGPQEGGLAAALAKGCWTGRTPGTAALQGHGETRAVDGP